jgi:glycosyltransferase involved in cell wall biosynthesis
MVDKRICMMTLGHHAFDDRIFFKEALSLRKLTEQVTVLAVGSRRNCQVGGVRIVVVERSRFAFFTLWRLWVAARKERARIYHLHEPQLLLVGFLLKVLRRAKIVYDIHEHLPEMVRDFSRRPPKVAVLLAKGFSLIEMLLVRLADAVIVTSDLLASRYAAASKHMGILYNYPRTDLFNNAQTVARELLDQYGKSRILLYHGQISRARGLGVLVKAVKQVAKKTPGLKLILLGPVFGNSYREELIELIRRQGAEELVDFLAPVSHKRVPQYVSLSEIGLVVLPSLGVFRESLPIKLMEYMACGVPVVASKLQAIERILKDAECGLLVDPTDVNDVAAAIHYLLKHPQEAKRMGQRGAKAVQERYNWSAMEKRLFALYEKLEEASC